MIKIRQQCWDRAATELGVLDSQQAADALIAQGFAVEIVDGDWGASYHAETDDEHNAVQSLEG